MKKIKFGLQGKLFSFLSSLRNNLLTFWFSFIKTKNIRYESSLTYSTFFSLLFVHPMIPFDMIKRMTTYADYNWNNKYISDRIWKKKTNSIQHLWWYIEPYRWHLFCKYYRRYDFICFQRFHFTKSELFFDISCINTSACEIQFLIEYMN